jgi:hypothetical protein
VQKEAKVLIPEIIMQLLYLPTAQILLKILEWQPKVYFSQYRNCFKGTQTFKQTWGDRALVDNWRFSKKMATIEDIKNEALEPLPPNPRRFEPAFYIEQIPTDVAKLDQLEKRQRYRFFRFGNHVSELFYQYSFSYKNPV